MALSDSIKRLIANHPDNLYAVLAGYAEAAAMAGAASLECSADHITNPDTIKAHMRQVAAELGALPGMFREAEAYRNSLRVTPRR